MNTSAFVRAWNQVEDLSRLAKAAYADVCTPGNPREVTYEIILEFYKKTL